MTDYRASLQNKLDKLEEERKRILSAIDVLDEIDSELSRSDTSSDDKSRSGARPGTITHAILSCLESSDEMLTTRQIYELVKQERTVSRTVLQTALHRLRKHSKIFKEENLWGLAGYVYESESDSTDHEVPAPKFTFEFDKILKT